MFVEKVFVAKGKFAPREQILFLNKESVALIIYYNQHYLIVDWGDRNPKTFVTGQISPSETKEEAVERILLDMTGYCNIDTQIPIPAIVLSRFYDLDKNLNRAVCYFPYLISLKNLERVPTFIEREEFNLDWLDEGEVRSAGLLENQLYMFERTLFAEDIS